MRRAGHGGVGWGLLALVVAAAGCGHTHHATDEPPAKGEGSKAKPAEKPAAPSPKPARAAGAPGDHVEVATAPGGLLEPGAEREIQDKLVARGLLDAGARSGKLDGRTEAALRRFQRDADLPETGLPDKETVRKLGLDPDQLFRRGDRDSR